MNLSDMEILVKKLNDVRNRVKRLHNFVPTTAITNEFRDNLRSITMNLDNIINQLSEEIIDVSN